ncbi:hypothetical protein AB0D91_46890 [Streptomyces canus]|uniref:hypothetical protein n=1 Tax=Streptomyces canus TaxID=58343 RepID=UPI00340A4C61
MGAGQSAQESSAPLCEASVEVRLHTCARELVLRGGPAAALAAGRTAGPLLGTRSYSFASSASFNRTGLSATTGSTDCADTTTSTSTTTTTAHTCASADRITDTGYTYDAFSRTTSLPDGTNLAYYTNDLVRQETTSTTNQIRALDAPHRLASWTTQTSTDGGSTWTTSAARTTHYADDGDSTTWTAEDTNGNITRNAEDLTGASHRRARTAKRPSPASTEGLAASRLPDGPDFRRRYQ